MREEGKDRAELVHLRRFAKTLAGLLFPVHFKDKREDAGLRRTVFVWDGTGFAGLLRTVTPSNELQHKIGELRDSSSGHVTIFGPTQYSEMRLRTFTCSPSTDREPSLEIGSLVQVSYIGRQAQRVQREVP